MKTAVFFGAGQIGAMVARLAGTGDLTGDGRIDNADILRLMKSI